MLTIEQILESLQAIIDGAEAEDGTERPLNDEEVQRYEDLERQLTTARRDMEIRSRNNAYNTPIRSDLHVHAGGQQAVQRTDEERAFSAYLRSGIPNNDLTYRALPDDAGMQFRAQAEGTGAAGGYLVPEGFRNNIIERLKGFGGLAAEAEHIQTSSGNPLPWPTADDTANSGEIVAENAQAAGGADKVFGVKTLGAYKYESTGVDGEPLKVSWELAQDTEFNLEDFVERNLATRIRRKQARDWVIGDGTGEPQGILPGGTTGVTIAVNAAGMTYANIVAATHVPDIAYREDGESIWVMSDGAAALIEGLVDLNGRPLMNMSTDGIAGKPARTLMGYRVVIDNSFPATFAGSAKTAVFGNVRRGYVIRDVKEVTLVVLRELFARTGQIGYLSWARADGLVQDPYAYTVITAAA